MSHDTPTARDRLIFALDVPTPERALELIDKLDGAVTSYKIGLELMMSGGAAQVLDRLEGANVFIDLKLPSDIDTTIERAVRVAADRGVRFCTLSTTATRKNIEAAKRGRGERAFPQLLFVSFLSSLNEDDFVELYGGAPESFSEWLVERSRVAVGHGCDGLIVSGDEIAAVREALPEAVIVSPGIRPGGHGSDDHKRSATPGRAIGMGSDWLVVGRPIRDADDPRAVAEGIVAEIEAALGAAAR